MKTYLAKWPNGDISIVTVKNQTQLFWTLDYEGDPTCAKIYEIPTRSFFQLSTSVKVFKNGNTKIETYSHEHTLKRFKWDDGITVKAFQQLVPEATEESITELSKQLGIGMV